MLRRSVRVCTVVAGTLLTATSLEARRQVILRRESVVCLILRFEQLKHLVVDGLRLHEAGHHLLALCDH